MNKKIERISELVKKLNEAAKAYYQGEQEIMSNFAYDALYDELVALGFTVVRPGRTFQIFPKALEEDAKVFCEKAKAYDLI